MQVQQTPAKRMATRSRWCRLPRTRCSHRSSHRRKACKSRCRYLARHSPHGEAKKRAWEETPCAPFRCQAAVPMRPAVSQKSLQRPGKCAQGDSNSHGRNDHHKALNLARDLPDPSGWRRFAHLCRAAGRSGLGGRDACCHRVVTATVATPTGPARPRYGSAPAWGSPSSGQ
jgi:hypothetical protein